MCVFVSLLEDDIFKMLNLDVFVNLKITIVLINPHTRMNQMFTFSDCV